MVTAPGDVVQSVDRALDVLEHLAASGGDAALSEVAERTGLPFGTAHRLLRTLASRGYVRQNGDRTYALGGSLLHLGSAAERLFGRWALPYLAQLVEISGETANLAVADGDAAVYVGQVPSRHRLRTFAEVGRHVMPHCTAVGKVLLAERPAAEAAELLRRTGLPRRTGRTITDMDHMLAELARVRRDGYAIDDGEEEVDVRCLAVPVRDSGRVIAAMSISGPESRLGEQRTDLITARMQAVADAFTTEVFLRPAPEKET